MAAGEGEAESVRYRVKPMNGPMHILIYASQQRSYRDLPVRLAEIANVYRNERSGTLHGMLRVRGLTMDDAHIFLREDQIEQEIFQLLDIVELVLAKTFGLSYRLDLATRPEKKLGTDATWDQAERARSEEHTSELQSPCNLVCRLLLEKKKQSTEPSHIIHHKLQNLIY